MPKRFITCASARYDGFGTQTIHVLPYLDRRGNSFREVEVLDEHVNWQLAKYASDLSHGYTPQEWKEVRERDLGRYIFAQTVEEFHEKLATSLNEKFAAQEAAQAGKTSG